MERIDFTRRNLELREQIALHRQQDGDHTEDQDSDDHGGPPYGNHTEDQDSDDQGGPPYAGVGDDLRGCSKRFKDNVNQFCGKRKLVEMSTSKIGANAAKQLVLLKDGIKIDHEKNDLLVEGLEDRIKDMVKMLASIDSSRPGDLHTLRDQMLPVFAKCLSVTKCIVKGLTLQDNAAWHNVNEMLVKEAALNQNIAHLKAVNATMEADKALGVRIVETLVHQIGGLEARIETTNTTLKGMGETLKDINAAREIIADHAKMLEAKGRFEQQRDDHQAKVGRDVEEYNRMLRVGSEIAKGEKDLADRVCEHSHTVNACFGIITASNCDLCFGPAIKGVVLKCAKRLCTDCHLKLIGANGACPWKVCCQRGPDNVLVSVNGLTVPVTCKVNYLGTPQHFAADCTALSKILFVNMPDVEMPPSMKDYLDQVSEERAEAYEQLWPPRVPLVEAPIDSI